MKTNRDGRDIKRVLEWLLRRRVVDAEIAKALGPMATATYSRRKEHDDFPTFEELEQIGDSFGLSAKVLQISFGYRGEDELILLNDEELALYRDLGGDTSPATVYEMTRKQDLTPEITAVNQLEEETA